MITCSGGATGGLGWTCPPNPKSRQKFSKKNAIKLVRYTLRLNNYVKILPPPPLPISLGIFRAGATTDYMRYTAAASDLQKDSCKSKLNVLAARFFKFCYALSKLVEIVCTAFQRQRYVKKFLKGIDIGKSRPGPG